MTVGKGERNTMFILFNDIKSLSIQGGVPPPYPPPSGMYIPNDIKGLQRIFRIMGNGSRILLFAWGWLPGLRQLAPILDPPLLARLCSGFPVHCDRLFLST